MKVALLGNMNNNNFGVARYLRDRGVDAHLFVFDTEFQHFQPSEDSLDDSYTQFTSHLPWGRVKHFARCPKQEILDVIEGFEVLFGCGTAPAYLEKANRTIDLFLHFGDDLYDIPFYSLKKKRNRRRPIRSYWLSRYQRRGIEHARFIATQSLITDETWIRKHFAISGEVISGMYPLLYDYVDEIPRHVERCSDERIRTFEQLRQDADFLLYHPTRHLWHDESDRWMWKRNDVLLHAFAQFLSAPEGPRSARLVMNEYGKDVEHTKALARSLGIAENIFWLPVLPRWQILYILSRSDLAVAQFGAEAFMSGTIQEMLASGTPMLNYGWSNEDSLPPAWVYPYLHAEDVEQATAALLRCWSEPESVRLLGEEAQRWWRGAVKASVDKYIWIAETAEKRARQGRS